jgi:small subunit ribosomal protein S13|uniref:Small ribosomal subunit protein uS13 n=1 Tax=uncultured bacterium Rifle_16ft_4_minimus_7469 TaxID=1665162 RepID=A0A0H4TCX9_9BACT|nr:30S ribosomal protein S13, small subunit ribosomal protein S13 [uncultured bacterium Rifle_16ft_4_minimus_7469]
MARIAGVDLPRDKRVEAALPYIFGVGPSRARQICRATGVSPNTRVRALAEDEVTRLREYIERTYKVEGDLRRDIAMDIRRLVEIGAYRGIRHKKSLPVRGQRTRTNARTRKGPKKTVGVRRKAASSGAAAAPAAASAAPAPAPKS